MLNEPVRGSLPDPGILSLSGLEQIRAYMQGFVPDTPLFRLLGPRVTQASSGTAVLHQPISPWFEVNEDFVDLTATAEYVVNVTALTGAPPSTYVRTVNLSLRYLRPCTVADEMVIARGRILHAGSSFTTVEALIEDAIGRAVAHATGSVLIRAMDPPPPPLSRPLEPIEKPVYPTPDPIRRPVAPVSPSRPDQPIVPPLGRLLGVEVLEVTEAKAMLAMPTTEWFCQIHREVSPGIIGTLGNLAIREAIATIAQANERLVILNATTALMAPVVPNGQQLFAVGTVCHRRADIIAPQAEITDQDGQIVSIVQGTCMLVERGARSTQRASDRVLLTVLFTDLVGSTERAEQLGDARWRALLDDHHTVIRRQLELHKGREVKTTGDGFLATFDAPTRAVHCARAIREGLSRLGLEIRAGIHTGECEVVVGDVAGVAVHVASRVQSTAQPGEILVSSTVRDLIAGSGLQLVDRGVHELKGLEGAWTLLAVKD